MRPLARKMESLLIACAVAVQSWPEMYSGRLGSYCRASLVELNVKTAFGRCGCCLLGAELSFTSLELQASKRFGAWSQCSDELN